MSQIVRCCACDERVRLPDVESDTWVRCPHCREEFQLSRIAKDLPPRLEVIGEPTLVIDSADNESMGEKDSGIVGMPAIIDPQRPNSSETETPEFEDGLGTPNPNLHANRVKARSNGSGWAIGKVALGGIAGLMLGQIILWWLPEPYRSDPFDLAKNVPSQLSFLLPPSTTATVDVTLAESAGAGEEIAVSSPLVEHAMPGGSIEEVSAISNGPPEPPTDLRILVQTAVAEDTAFEERGSYEGRHVASWYESLRQLSACVSNITTLSSVNDAVVLDMQKFLVYQVADEPMKVSAITQQAIAQIREGEPVDQQGIVVAGEVLSIKPAGELYRTKIRLVGTETTVDVVSRQDPTAEKAYAQKDSVLILGVVLTSPASLQGYKGDDRPVIFGGFPINLDAFEGTTSP